MDLKKIFLKRNLLVLLGLFLIIGLQLLTGGDLMGLVKFYLLLIAAMNIGMLVAIHELKKKHGPDFIKRIKQG